MTILNFKGPYKEFSNFEPVTIFWKGLKFPTVEHAYVASKSTDPKFWKKISQIDANKAGLAKRLGRKCQVRPNWDTVKVHYMEQFLIQKFKYEKFEKKLINTWYEKLVEGNWWHDNFWGNCLCEKCSGIEGQNMLGELLMIIRDQKRKKNMKILITGDIHGDFGVLNRLINTKHPDLTICCGDFGYWPKFSGKQLSDIKTHGSPLLWIDGNHEDHWTLAQRESDEIEPNIIYKPRGSTHTLDDGRKILFMGGAESIDKNMRVLGRDWFPEEIIRPIDMENLPDEDIDIIISHTCPLELVDIMLKYYPEKRGEPSNQALTQLWDMYNPKIWIFGHWHYYKEGMMGGTKWYALSYPRQGSRWWMWLPTKEVMESFRK